MSCKCFSLAKLLNNSNIFPENKSLFFGLQALVKWNLFGKLECMEVYIIILNNIIIYSSKILQPQPVSVSE